MSQIAVLVGNPQPSSRTRAVAEDLAAALAARAGVEVDATIDLAEVSGALFRFPDDGVDLLLERVAQATVVVVASPTYKASYTGMLKAFLDRYGAGGLSAVTAIPLFTIGSPAHALAVDVTLRPLLVELGASVPTRSVVFPTSAFEERARFIDDWIEREWPRVAPVLTSS